MGRIRISTVMKGVLLNRKQMGVETRLPFITAYGKTQRAQMILAHMHVERSRGQLSLFRATRKSWQ